MGNNTFRYTPQQVQFLRDYYPDHVAAATAAEFSRLFGIPRSKDHIRWYVEKLGIKVSRERLLEVKKQNVGKNGRTNNIGKTVPVGTIRVTKKTGGEPYIKTETGWVMLKKYLVDCPEGMHIVHLDGDVTNCDPDNLMAIDPDVHARMAVNHFWSDNPELTRTGIECCKLESTLAKNGFDVKKKPKQKPLKGLFPKTNTGEWHIQKTGNYYRVKIRRGSVSVNRTRFTTMNEAISFRDDWLEEKGLPLVDERFSVKV